MSRARLAFGSMLVAFLIALALYALWYASVAALSGKVQGLATELATRSRAELRIAAARAALANLAASESAIASYFVAQQDVVPFIERLQALGSAPGASISVLSVAAGPGTPAPILITLSIGGTFDQVVRAVGAIENAPYALSTTGLSLSAAKGATGAWQATMHVSVGSLAPSVATSTTP